MPRLVNVENMKAVESSVLDGDGAWPPRGSVKVSLDLDLSQVMRS